MSNNYIKIDTLNTSLLFGVYDKQVEKLYYGERIPDAPEYSVYRMKRRQSHPSVDDVVRKNDIISYFGQGNSRQFLVELEDEDGCHNLQFELESVKQIEGAAVDIKGLPYAHGKTKTVVFEFRDKVGGLSLFARYSAFDDCDAICVSHAIKNNSKKPYVIKRFMSMQLDIDETGHELTYYDGAWARERQCKKIKLDSGVFFTGSSSGFSSNRYNPFWMLKTSYGGYYATNLLYSGNHKEIAEALPIGLTRIMTGINDERFAWKLEPKETFDTPEAVMAYGESQESITTNMHVFVKNHILRGAFKEKPRPIVLNSWEAMYYDFTKERLLELAKVASEVGVEMFVLDDGWFGGRDCDDRALGDWTDNPKKTGGLKDLSGELHAMGLQFGLWFEPEMISPDSDLYRKHPEFVLRGKRSPVVTRSQLVMDLVNPKVADYIVSALDKIIVEANVDFIKWDCNRVMTDVYSKFSRGGEYAHRYILALYNILERITSAHPHVLFESCAGGGSRYDLGLLAYMPQVWTSDNTDCADRLLIQEGTLVAYPPCTLSAHVSICPNYQTSRTTNIAARFNVATAGVLGYEYDLTKCSKEEKQVIGEQIAFYKKHRDTFQYGDYFLIESAFDTTKPSWIKVAKDKSFAIAVIVRVNEAINRERGKYRLRGLCDDANYKVTVKDKDTTFAASGKILNSYGLDLTGLFGYDALFEPVSLMLIIERE